MKNIFLIYGPSGSGQDVIIEGLKKFLPIKRVVTTVSRPQRKGESEGRPYHFISPEEFVEKIEAGQFVEYTQKYNGVWYGVTQEELAKVTQGNALGIWKVDYKGVETIKKKFPGIIAILIIAPLEILERRIRRRDQNNEEYIQSRMEHNREYFIEDITYDYKVENEEGKLDQAIQKVADIIRKEARG